MKKIFLNYAREDVRYARRLYTDLTSKGDFDIWFDEEAILPGHKWKKEVEDAIDNADFFILLYSKKSVNKTGYVHAEIQKAINRHMEMKEGKPFIIPIRLDECELGYSALKEIHSEDLFPESEYPKKLDRILKIISKDESKPEPKPHPAQNRDIKNKLREDKDYLIRHKGEYEKHIIIWHTKNDVDYARRVYNFLDKLKFKVLLSNNEGFKKEEIDVPEAINSAAYFIPLLSSSSNNATRIENEMLNTAVKQQKGRKEKDIFIIPVQIDDFNSNKMKVLSDIYPVKMFIENDDIEEDVFQDAMNSLLESIINHLQFWDFEGKNKDLLKNATAGATERYISIITNYNKSKEPLDSNDYFVAALNSFAKKRYSEALKRFLLASNHGLQMEKRPEILSKIGACYIKLKNLQEAKKVLAQAIKIDPSYPSSWYNQGILLKKDGKYKEAINSFDRAIIEMGKNKHARIRAAYINKSTTHKELYKATADISYIEEAIKTLSNKKVHKDESGLIEYNLACFHALRDNKGDKKETLDYLSAAFGKDIQHIEDSKSEIEFLTVTKENRDDFWNLVSKHSEEHYKKLKKLMTPTKNEDENIAKIKDMDIEGLVEIVNKLKKAEDLLYFAQKKLQIST